MGEPGAGPAGHGEIILARHGEPALSRRIRLSADGYRRWWAAYEDGGILADQNPPQPLIEVARGADQIFSSTRKRAVETAQALVGGRTFTQNAVFIEAPLPPPPLPAFIRLKPRTWGFLARSVWWFCGYHEGQETRQEAHVRAAKAADLLISQAQSGAVVLVLAHGFFNLMIGRALKSRGWLQQDGRGYSYWTTRRFVPGPHAT